MTSNPPFLSPNLMAGNTAFSSSNLIAGFTAFLSSNLWLDSPTFLLFLAIILYAIYIILLLLYFKYIIFFNNNQYFLKHFCNILLQTNGFNIFFLELLFCNKFPTYYSALCLQYLLYIRLLQGCSM